jgi:murein L,D-transpeptidase YcbB/YkuD
MAGHLASSGARSVAPAAIGVILTSLAVGCQSRTPEELPQLTAVLAEKTLGRQTTAPSEVRTAVRKFYELRATTFAWTAKRPIRSAADALTVLASAEAHGLEREDYGYAGLVAARNRLRENPPKGDAGLRELARFDVRLTTSLVALGHDVAVGRARPGEWRSQRKSPDLAKTLFDAREGRLSSWLDSVRPQHDEYVGLQRALANLRSVEAKGGWPDVPRSLVRPSARTVGDAVRRRLQASGDLAMGGTTEDAVRSFQSHHGLSPTGRLDRLTVASMKVPLAERIRQVRINLERWRWMPDDLGERHIRVNIPEFHLKVIEDRRAVLDIRAIVGRPEDKTPIFSARMAAVVFSPYWNIPETIAMGETLPEIANDPGFLARNSIEVVRVSNGSPEVLDPEAIDWTDPEELQRVSFRQRPGDGNALGLVKFLFPNPYNVYVHDTPADHLFTRVGRTLSHGCVRIEQPVALAEYVLRDQSHWTLEAIQEAMKAGAEKVVKLSTPIPIHLTYFTAWSDDEGGLNFRDDVYGYDRLPSKGIFSN